MNKTIIAILTTMLLVSAAQADYTWGDGTKYVGTETSTDACKYGTITFPNGDNFTGTYHYDNCIPKRGTHNWENGDTFTGTFDKDGQLYAGSYVGIDGYRTTYTGGVENVPWLTEEGWTFDEITEDKFLTKTAIRYAEELYPGISEIVEFRVGDVDTYACDCGGFADRAVINGEVKYRIAISEKWFLDYKYNPYFGYVEDALQSVAHEIAHILDYEENGWDAEVHGRRFKHFYQDIVPPHLEYLEEEYDYPDGEPSYNSDIDY